MNPCRAVFQKILGISKLYNVMIRNSFAILKFLLAGCLLLPMLAHADQRFVTDQFEVMLRTGPSGNHSIVRMLKSGVALEVMDQEVDNGYLRVQTNAGTEGWVLARYLIREPVARVQLEDLVKRVTQTEPKEKSINGQLNFIKTEFENAHGRIEMLEQEKKELEKQLSDIKNTAANVLTIDAENKRLQQDYHDVRTQLMALQENYSELSSDKEREWFVTGALVLFGGLLLGLIIPKISWRKRSPYGDF